MAVATGRVTFSGMPDGAIYAALRGVDCWWNLARELGHLLPTMRLTADEVLWADIPDYEAPPDPSVFVPQLVRVCQIIGEGGHVHVSCLGGRGRTGMALASVRVRLYGEDAEAALNAAKALTGGGPEVEEQREFVRTLARACP